MENMHHLAAAVLLATFDDLADEHRTQYVYAAFYESDYCKALFEIAGVKYDPYKISARIAQRPRPYPRYNQDTYTQRLSIKDTKTLQRRTYTFIVENGYIVRIMKDGYIYRLVPDSEKKEASYIAERAFDMLRSGRYYLEMGV